MAVCFLQSASIRRNRLPESNTDEAAKDREKQACWQQFRISRFCAASDRSISCPIRNQTPSQGRDQADRIFRMLPDYRYRLHRGDIEARRPIVLPIGSVEIL